MRCIKMVCLLFAASATAFHSPSPMKLVSDFTARSQAVQMVTVAPERTITKPPPLPDKWEVPDTFSLSSLKTPDTKEPSMFKLTLFRSRVTDARVLGALMEVVEGMDRPRAELVLAKAKSMGFSLVGVYPQPTAERFADGLRSRDLVVDVSPE